jgi:hypothetical protein
LSLQIGPDFGYVVTKRFIRAEVERSDAIKRVPTGRPGEHARMPFPKLYEKNQKRYEQSRYVVENKRK